MKASKGGDVPDTVRIKCHRTSRIWRSKLGYPGRLALGTLRRADLALGDDWSWRDFSRAIGAHPRGKGARRRGTLGARSAPRSADGLICGGALKMKGPETRELLTLLPDLLRGGVLRGRDRRDRALARSTSPCRRGSREQSRLRADGPPQGGSSRRGRRCLLFRSEGDTLDR